MKENTSDQNTEYILPAGLDLETVWNGIEKKRNLKKKRRRLVFFLPFFLFALLLGSWFLGLENVAPIQVVASQLQKEIPIGPPVLKPSIEVKAAAHFITKLQSKKTKESIRIHKNLNTGINQGVNVLTNKPEVSEITSLEVGQSNQQHNSFLLLKSIDDIMRGAIIRPNTIHPLFTSLDIPVRTVRGLRLSFNSPPYHKKWLMGSRLNLGVGYRNLMASSTATIPERSFLEQRELSEQVLESYGMECFVKRTLSRNVFLEMGFVANNITSRSSANYDLESFQAVEGDSSIVVEHLDGRLEYSSGITTQKNMKTYLSYRYNHFWSIGIPVRLGYQKAVSDKLALGLSLGLIYNFSSTGTGYVIVPKPSTETYIPLSDAGDFNPHLFQSSTQALFRYKLKYRWILEGGLVYNRDLNMRQGLLSYSDKYQALNAQIGVLYSLN